jgi:hypothetical protein
MIINYSSVTGTITTGSLGTGSVSFNPLFVDTTDFKLKNEYDNGINSPLLEASAPTDTHPSGQIADMGAWNYDRSDIVAFYQQSRYFPKPANHAAIRYRLNSPDANLEIGSNGVPTNFNDPNRLVDFIEWSLRTVEDEDLEFIKYIYSLNDTRVLLALFPDVQITLPSVTVNGNQSGTAELAINNTGFIAGGSVITVGGVDYDVLYPIPKDPGTAATALVLDRPLDAAVNDTDPITIKYALDVSEWTAVIQRDINYSKPKFNSVEFVNGLSVRFVRKSE